MTDPGRAIRVHESWQRAAAFAMRHHTGQVRKDGVTPYASHPARVAMTLVMVFGESDPECITAAFLHDTIEDTPADYDDIHEAFGPTVADIVAALTKNMILPEAERERDYDERLASADWRARLIKLADCYDNLADIDSRLDASPANRASILDRHFKRCDRALALVESDCGEHVSVRRAIEALEALIKDVRAQGS